jgi:hypothetical protein
MEKLKETLSNIGFIAFIVLVWAYTIIPMVIGG